jgi:DNA polymerase-1
MKPDYILVDGSSYLFRAYHALPPLTNAHGEATGAIYGVVNMLRRLHRDYPGAQVVVVFDPPGKTFRDDLYPEYKAHRPPMPDDLREQIEPLLDVIRAMGLPLIIEPGFEADDVIGTLAEQGRAGGHEVLISTGDKDMAQLVGPHITLVNTMTDTVMDAEGVFAKFGVRPDQIIDYLTLVGDSVDNVPGVEKVGPKTAAKWLAEHQTLDAIMQGADAFKGKIGENLRAALGHLPLSKRLVTIRCDVPIPEQIDALQQIEPDAEALRTWFARLEFKTWLRELGGGDVASATSQNDASTTSVDVTDMALPPLPAFDPAQIEVIQTEAALQQWIERLQSAERWAVDTETTSLDGLEAEIVGVSFAVDGEVPAYLPLAHDAELIDVQLSRDATLARLKPLLEDATPKKVGQNLKYDMGVLANHGIALRGIAEDTMLESYVLDSTATRHDLDSLATKYLHHTMVAFEDIAGKGKNQLTFNQIALEQAAPYAAEDAWAALALHAQLAPRLSEAPRLQEVYREIELPLISVLSRMERIGILVDAEHLQEQSAVLGQRLVELEMKAHEAAGQVFNLSSPKQLQEILFDQLGLPVLKKTPKGQPSTAEDVLEQLAEEHSEQSPLPGLILQQRGLSKLKSTYADRLPEQIHSKTGRVHTSFHQAVTATGRLSSSDPNLQNIPIRTEEGRRIRRAFVAPKGMRMVSADYSQIELRIMAHLSEDEGLLRAFNQGEDVHRATAAEVFGVVPQDVSQEQRRNAKAINFGLIYGMSAFGLAKQLNIGRAEAQEYVNLYFQRYPGVREFMDRTREQARALGYVETVFGRRLYLPEINARNAQRRQYAERTAINAPMQGTAADIIKRAMLAVDGWLYDAGTQIDARMVLQVHDELVFEVAEKDVDALIAGVIQRMQAAAELKVPLEVGVGVGANWDEAH